MNKPTVRVDPQPQSFPFTSANVREKTARPTVIIPHQSTLVPANGSWVSGRMRSASAMPRIPIGTLIAKIQCQLANSISTPPIGGPSAAAALATTAIIASPRPRWAGGKTSAVVASASGARMPAPTACSTRNAISALMDQASEHSSEPIVKTVIPIRKNRRRPNWSASRPIETSRTANMML